MVPPSQLKVPLIHTDVLCFYNGKQPYNTDSVLKLSDAFTQKHDEYALELSVKVININYDKGSPILKSSKPLEQYSRFVDTVRRHVAIDREHGFENAIKECMQHDILREYLQRKSKEIINMLIGEYDYDTDIAVQREEAGKIAFAQGVSQGSRQKALETAAAFKRFGFDIDKIAEGTGLTREEIEKL